MSLTWLKALLGFAAPAEKIAEAIDPALGKSVTLTQINTGVAAFIAVLPDLQACVTDHFRNLGEDATLVEALAQDVSSAVPAVATVSSSVADVAALIVMLCNLGIIQTSPIPATPAVIDGINPASGAPLFT